MSDTPAPAGAQLPLWLAHYGLVVCAGLPVQCLRPVAGLRCRLRCGARYCEACVPREIELVLSDHGHHLAGPDGLRLWVGQPYQEDDGEAAEWLSVTTRALGLYAAAHPRGTGWWAPGTAMIVVSNRPIPDHGYAWDARRAAPAHWLTRMRRAMQ